jgi:hypothetical protein
MFKGLWLLAATEAAGAVRRQIKALPWFAGGAVIALFGAGALMEAARLWLSSSMTPLAVELLIAAVLVASAIVLAFVGAAVRSRRQTRSGLSTTALVAAPMAARLMRRHATLSALAVAGTLAAGALVGRIIGRSA